MDTSKSHNFLTAATPLRVAAVIFLVVALAATTLIPAQSVQAASSPVTIYGDSLASGWQDWSWNSTRSLSNPSPVQSGSASIALTITNAWGALYLHRSSALSTSGYTTLEFYIHGGSTGSQSLNVIANSNTSKPYKVTAPVNAWARVSIPLSSLGSPASITDLYWQDAKGAAQPKLYIDAIALTGGTVAPTATKPAATATKPAVTATQPAATATQPAATATQPAVTATQPAPTATKPAPTATTPPTGTKYFSLLPPGSALPSDATCAAAVKARAETKGINKTYNATKGSQTIPASFFSGDDSRAGSYIAPRVTGNFAGTTDEILQWTACKWGFDEDAVRAQAAIESWWRQTVKGDWTTDSSRCAPGHGLGVDGTAGQCPESFGILQNRYPYEQSAWPGIYNSTAFNADIAYAEMRACYEGYETWLGSGYAAGDSWGCVGRWFAGRWHTSDAEGYITRVKDYLNQRIWETSGFQEP